MVTNRVTKTIPADGVFIEIPIAARAVYVEAVRDSGGDNITSPADVPTIHAENRDDDGIPIYPRLMAYFREPVHRFFLEGSAAAEGGEVLLFFGEDPCVVLGFMECEEPGTEAVAFIDTANLAFHRNTLDTDDTGGGEVRAIASGDLIYLIGGFQQSGVGSEAEDQTLRYDPSDGSITVLDNMPAGRYGGAAGQIGGTIFYVGGRSLSGGFPTNETDIFSYDIATDTWTTLATVATVNIVGAKSVVYDNKLWIFIGSDATSVTRQICVYDPVAGSFSTVVSIPGASTSDHAPLGDPVVFGNRIVFLQGRSSNLLVFNPATGTIDTVTGVYQTGAESPYCELLGGRYYVAAGGQLWDGSGPIVNSSEVFNSIEIIDLFTMQSLGTGQMVTTERWFAAATAVIGNTMFIFGGMKNNNSPNEDEHVRAIGTDGDPF